LASERLHASLPMRTQFNLSDWDFIKGILTDIGAFALWQPGDSVDNLGTWYLTSRLDALEQSGMHYRYAQSSVQSGQDTINTLQMSVKQLGSATVQVKADGLEADIIYEGQASDESPLALDDSTVLFGLPSRINSDEAAAQLAAQWVAANNCQRETYRATGAMRGVVYTGSLVNISHLPAIGGLSAYCLESHVMGIEPDSDSVSYNHRTFIQDWLRKVTQHRLNSIPEHGYEILFETGMWASATLLRATIPYTLIPAVYR
jgi:type VI secretion system secreted protein VgrG